MLESEAKAFVSLIGPAERIEYATTGKRKIFKGQVKVFVKFEQMAAFTDKPIVYLGNNIQVQVKPPKKKKETDTTTLLDTVKPQQKTSIHDEEEEPAILLVGEDAVDEDVPAPETTSTISSVQNSKIAHPDVNPMMLYVTMYQKLKDLTSNDIEQTGDYLLQQSKQSAEILSDVFGFLLDSFVSPCSMDPVLCAKVVSYVVYTNTEYTFDCIQDTYSLEILKSLRKSSFPNPKFFAHVEELFHSHIISPDSLIQLLQYLLELNTVVGVEQFCITMERVLTTMDTNLYSPIYACLLPVIEQVLNNSVLTKFHSRVQRIVAKLDPPSDNAPSQHHSQQLTCIVCYDKPRNVLFLECKHLVLCDTCSEPLTECPICRVQAVNKLKVIFS